MVETQNGSNIVENIEDYLRAKDWKYTFEAMEGSESGYSWMKTKDMMIDPLSAVTHPEQFKIVILDYAQGPGAEAFGNKAGWTKVGDYAFSPVYRTLPDLPLHEAIYMMYDPREAPDMESLIGKHQLYCHRDIFEEELPLLANTLSTLKAFLYLGNTYDFVFLAQDQTMAEMKSSEAFLSLPERAREQVCKRRDRMWQQIGPEVGPDLCINEGCEHKRLQLTPRCFIHQMQMQGK